jgi:hypothetical protein
VSFSELENDTLNQFNVGTASLEARNIRLVNIITYIIEESKLISENMSPNMRKVPSISGYVTQRG